MSEVLTPTNIQTLFLVISDGVPFLRATENEAQELREKMISRGLRTSLVTRIEIRY